LFGIRQCINALMENVNWAHNGPGPVVWNFCGNVVVAKSDCLGKHNYNTGWGYHHTVGVVNGFQFLESDVRGVRHVFTTTSGIAIGSDPNMDRWGTARNCLIRGIRCGNNGRLNESYGQIMLDTHAEGWGVTFDDCHIDVPAEQSNRAFSFRARNTIIKNSTIHGGGSGCQGGLIWGPDCKVINNTFRNLWYGLKTDTLNGVDPTGAVIEGNRFDRLAGPALRVFTGSGHHFCNNSVHDASYLPYSDYYSAAVQFDGGSGHRCCRNELPKYSQAYSVHGGNCDPTELTIIGNVLDGYGAGAMGVDPTPTSGPALEAAYVDKNWTD
jgi:hypothetical protein